MNRLIQFTLIVAACLSFANAAWAAGGMYVDNVLVTSDGASVFADSFDRGDLKGWDAQNAVLLATRTKPQQYCVHLNRTNRGMSRIERPVSLGSVGKLELSAWISLPPVEQQDNYSGSRCCSAGFVIYAGNPDDFLTTALLLQPKGAGYRASAEWHDAVRRNTFVKAATDEPVLSGGKWTLATMRLDPAEGTVSLLLDGKLACRISYKPERFKSISSIRLFSDLGG